MAPSGIKISPVGVAIILVLLCGSMYYFFGRAKETSSSSVSGLQVSLRSLLIASIDFAERGGVQVKKIRESNDLSEKSKGETKEGANDPLTMGDLLSHQAITGSFRTVFPGVPLISEEKDALPSTMEIKSAPTENSEVSKIIGADDEMITMKDVTIWVDPLDATQEYTENLLQYVTTMVCIAVKGRPVIGVIHKPFGKENENTYWSWVGHGSNIKEKHIGNEGEHRIIVSRSHAGKVDETAKKAFGNNVHVIPAGGAGYKSLALFEGIASVYLHTTLIKKWDICAGNAVLDHAGGKMTNLAGSRIDYSASGDPKNDGGLVASLHNHQEYLNKLGYA